MQPSPQSEIIIRENYAENTVDAFIQYIKSGVRAPNVPDFVRLQPAAIWCILRSITKTVLPKNELYDVVMRIVHLPTFTKYIEYAFCKFIPCESIVPANSEGESRSLVAVQIACSYHHLLPQTHIIRLQELRELAAFYANREWGKQIRAIFEAHRPTLLINTIVNDDVEADPITLWDRLFRAVFMPDDYLVGSSLDTIQQQQIEKLARLAREIVLSHIPDSSVEFRQLLIIVMPAIIEAIFIKPSGYLTHEDRATVIGILGKLITFFQKYAHAKSLPGDVASHMFAELGHFDVAIIITDKLTAALDMINHPKFTPQIKLALVKYIRAQAGNIVDVYLNAQYVQRLIERLVEDPIDFDGPAPLNTTSIDIDDEYSYQLGTLLSELFNYVVKCGSGRGLSSYLLGASLLKFSKVNGDAVQRAHAEFVAGTCSMKPLIIAHHLMLRRIDGKLVSNLHTLAYRHTKNLHDAIMQRIRDAAATSVIAQFALQLSSGLLSAIISSLLEIVSDTRLIHIFVAMLL